MRARLINYLNYGAQEGLLHRGNKTETFCEKQDKLGQPGLTALG